MNVRLFGKKSVIESRKEDGSLGKEVVKVRSGRDFVAEGQEGPDICWKATAVTREPFEVVCKDGAAPKNNHEALERGRQANGGPRAGEIHKRNGLASEDRE